MSRPSHSSPVRFNDVGAAHFDRAALAIRLRASRVGGRTRVLGKFGKDLVSVAPEDLLDRPTQGRCNLECGREERFAFPQFQACDGAAGSTNTLGQVFLTPGRSSLLTQRTDVVRDVPPHRFDCSFVLESRYRVPEIRSREARVSSEAHERKKPKTRPPLACALSHRRGWTGPWHAWNACLGKR